MRKFDNYRQNLLLKRIHQEQKKLESLSNSELQAKALFVKEQLVKAGSLNERLAEVFALVCETVQRLKGVTFYDVQILGGMVLSQNKIAEMKTGEGKTLTALFPLYLKALAGKKVFLLTPNTYLATRDAKEVADVFDFLGLKVGLAAWDYQVSPSLDDKKKAYQADIIYTTSAQLGFDYLIDNLAESQEAKFLPSFDYGLVDEADTILLDMVQTPLIISGSPRVQSPLYQLADQFVRMLDHDDFHYQPAKKEVWLTSKGIDQAESFFRINHFYAIQHFELVKHVTLALKAHYLYQQHKDYLVKEGKIRLIDQETGRLLSGTKLQGGLHQAIEVKEGLELSQELRTVATITYQNLFLLFNELAGMTGTAKTARKDFQELYKMEVVAIPPHLPVSRRDLPDLYFVSLEEKLSAILGFIKKHHSRERPILVVTSSLKLSQFYSQLLLEEGLPHTLLNAQSEAREAEIIAGAGKKGAITIATQMAGRGTDIRLDADVLTLGGLVVLGTERFSNSRIDLQIRGRSGRQGEPGISQFFVSLEDNLLVESIYHDKLASLTKRYFSGFGFKKRCQNLVKKAQETNERIAQEQRVKSLAFDRSIKFQRDRIYRDRNRLLEDKAFKFDLSAMIDFSLNAVFPATQLYSAKQVEDYMLTYVTYHAQLVGQNGVWTSKEAKGYLKQLILKQIKKKQETLSKQDFYLFLRLVSLKALDEAWIEEVDYLQQLRLILGNLSVSQSNPLFDYHQQAFEGYQNMQVTFYNKLVGYLCLSEVSYTSSDRLKIYFG